MNRTISRRTFLASATAAAAASAAVFATRRARAEADERIGVAVIGCRNRGHQDASFFADTGQFDIVSLCDCDTAMIDRAKAELGGKLTRKPKEATDFRRVLEDKDVDAVIIATPDHWHALMAVLALDAGKHVYLEKPASFNIQDGQTMMAAATRHPKLTFTVGTQQRSGDHFRDARKFIASGGLGKVAFCRTWVTHTRERIAPVPNSEPPATMNYDAWVGPAPMRPYNENQVHYNWRFMRDYGTGEMGNWGAHWIDVARWFLDLDVPMAVTGHGGSFVEHDIKEWPDTQTVLYEFPNLTMLWEQRLWTTFDINGRDGGVEIDGERGSVVIDRGGWEYHPRDGKADTYRATPLEQPHAQNFADSIRGLAEPAAPIEEGHKTAVLCHLGNIATLLCRRIEYDATTQRPKNDPEAAALCERAYRTPWTLPEYG